MVVGYATWIAGNKQNVIVMTSVGGPRWAEWGNIEAHGI